MERSKIVSVILGIDVIAKRDIGLCTNQEDLLKCGKLWKRYFAEVNRFLAGKRPECPYVSDDGRNII